MQANLEVKNEKPFLTIFIPSRTAAQNLHSSCWESASSTLSNRLTRQANKLKQQQDITVLIIPNLHSRLRRVLMRSVYILCDAHFSQAVYSNFLPPKETTRLTSSANRRMPLYSTTSCGSSKPNPHIHVWGLLEPQAKACGFKLPTKSSHSRVRSIGESLWFKLPVSLLLFCTFPCFHPLLARKEKEDLFCWARKRPPCGFTPRF